MNTISKFGLRNFRAFKERLNLDLAPITILTGPNNSGKSTVIRALKLLTESSENDGLWNILRGASDTDYQSFQNLKSKESKEASVEFSLEIENYIRNENSTPETFSIELGYSCNPYFSAFGSLTSFRVFDSNMKIVLSDNDKEPLYNKFQSQEHTGPEGEKDYSFIKKQEIINNVAEIIKYKLFYLPTHRSKPQREFNRSDGNYLSKLLFAISDNKHSTVNDGVRRSWNSDINGPLFVFTNEMVRLFKLGTFVTFTPNNFNGNYELTLNCHDNSRINIADLGSGVYNLIAIFLNVDLAASVTRFIRALDGPDFSHITGPGKLEQLSNRLILIEEPENSLHPNYQSLLADVFVEAYKMYGVRFIVETHSEYLIQKLQYIVANNDMKFDKNSILFYYFSLSEKSIAPYPISITSDGHLTKGFGSGFIDESTKLLFDLWKARGLN